MQMMIAAFFMGQTLPAAPRLGKPVVTAPRRGLDQKGLAPHTAAMNRDKVNAICAALPGAQNSDPWGGGHDAWKVGGKLFAVVGAMDGGVSLKTPDVETAQLLIDMGRAEKAAYFHRSWVFLPWGICEESELYDRLRQSYDIIRAKLPKKLQATLGAPG